MNILYIGQNNHGSTSGMRAKILSELFTSASFELIDTSIPFNEIAHVYRTIGFRYKIGPLIKEVNSYVLQNIKSKFYDLIWVDKGVYITAETTRLLKSFTSKLVHYTPDPAFLFHKSHHFQSSIKLYDYCITSKSYELEIYQKYLPHDKLIITTQGFDKNLHRPYHSFEEKIPGVIFVGHCEKNRKEIIELLIKNDIPVYIAGLYWDKMANYFRGNSNFNFLGKGIFGEEYARTISKFTYGLGLMSKWVPELHTTRTFEIPACGTALITEKNKETELFFKDDEVIFYSKPEEIPELINCFKVQNERLQDISMRGFQKMHDSGEYEYSQLLKLICIKIGYAFDS